MREEKQYVAARAAAEERDAAAATETRQLEKADVAARVAADARALEEKQKKLKEKQTLAARDAADSRQRAATAAAEEQRLKDADTGHWCRLKNAGDAAHEKTRSFTSSDGTRGCRRFPAPWAQVPWSRR